MSDADRRLHAIMLADTDEWEDTAPSIDAQRSNDESWLTLEDTGVVIVDKPAETGVPGQSDQFVITFREPSIVAFRERTTPPPRAATEGWPPPPRGPAPPL